MRSTVGLLSFNAFHPNTLPVMISSVVNIVRPKTPETPAKPSVPAGETPPSTGNTSQKDPGADYIIMTRFVTADESGLKGRMTINGRVEQDAKKNERLNIVFTSGRIEPDDGQDLTTWRAVIGRKDVEYSMSSENGENATVTSALAKPKRKRDWVKETIVGLMLKLAFGYRPPGDVMGSKGELEYRMERSPKGTRDILHLDQDMNISRGNKGTIVVLTRQ